MLTVFQHKKMWNNTIRNTPRALWQEDFEPLRSGEVDSSYIFNDHWLISSVISSLLGL